MNFIYEIVTSEKLSTKTTPRKCIWIIYERFRR